MRELTHTLHLPPAQSEIYDGPHPQWLRDALEQLPHLQSLVVSQLPFFDHQSLQALRSRSDSTAQTSPDTHPTFGLRLLIAEKCRNATSSSLAEALSHLPNLVFLDLSNTSAARDSSVLSKLRYMLNLQVLKLRQTNLRDNEIETIAAAVGPRVRSLDLRGNALTDMSARILLDLCFEEANHNDGLVRSTVESSADGGGDDWPSGIARPDPDLLDDFRNDRLDQHFIKQLAKPTVGRLPSEDLPPSGITHLYISDNHLTVEGLSRLVKSERLFVLDAGAARPFIASKRPRSLSSTFSPSLKCFEDLSGVEKLTPVLEKYAYHKMTSLRLHHAAVTKNIPLTQDDNLSVPCELSAKNTRYEVDGTEQLYELPSDEVEPRYELPGDSAHFYIDHRVGEMPSSSAEEVLASPCRGAAFAPEVVEETESDDDRIPILNSTGLMPLAQAINGINNSQASPGTWPGDKLELSISLIEQQRQELRSRCKPQPHGLLPGMLPRLRTLTLTNVPCNDTCNNVVSALIQFIHDCASEAELAGLQASLLKSTLIRSAGKLSLSRFEDSARDIFALSQIILEMEPSSLSSNNNPKSPRTPQNARFEYRTKSSTEDADSEALWSAQENDFTFFADEEECGLPAQETELRFPLSTLSEKILLPTDEAASGPLSAQIQTPSSNPGADVVDEVAKFRRNRKAAYEEAVKQGKKYVDGYWPGEVKVVKWNAKHVGNQGYKDYYGNCFEKGIYR